MDVEVRGTPIGEMTESLMHEWRRKHPDAGGNEYFLKFAQVHAALSELDELSMSSVMGVCVDLLDLEVIVEPRSVVDVNPLWTPGIVYDEHDHPDFPRRKPQRHGRNKAVARRKKMKKHQRRGGKR